MGKFLNLDKQKLLEAILDTAPNIVFLYNYTQKSLEITGKTGFCKWLGYSDESLKNQHQFESCIYEDDLALFLDIPICFARAL